MGRVERGRSNLEYTDSPPPEKGLPISIPARPADRGQADPDAGFDSHERPKPFDVKAIQQGIFSGQPGPLKVVPNEPNDPAARLPKRTQGPRRPISQTNPSLQEAPNFGRNHGPRRFPNEPNGSHPARPSRGRLDRSRRPRQARSISDKTNPTTKTPRDDRPTGGVFASASPNRATRPLSFIFLRWDDLRTHNFRRNGRNRDGPSPGKPARSPRQHLDLLILQTILYTRQEIKQAILGNRRTVRRVAR